MNTSSPKLSEERWVLASLLLLPLFLAAPCWAGYAWAEGDLVRQFYPWKELGRQILASHQLPLWNPYAYCGMPLFGNFQSALAYPLHLPFYFLSFAPALGWHLFIHFFISGLGFYFLGRALGLSRGPALLAALSWQCNAFLLARVEFMSALSAYAWTPWILWCVAARRSAALTALLIALQSLAGYPLELGYSLMASLAFALFIGNGAFKRLLPAWALGLAAGAIQLLPGIELILQSSRLAGDPSGQASKFLHLPQLQIWAWPFQRQFWAFSLSISLPVFLLAPFARGKAALLALAFLIVSLTMSFGLGANWLPNRHPSIALIYASLALALLTGLGAETLKARLKWPLVALLSAVILTEAIIPWTHRDNLVQADLYGPADSAQYLASHVQPGMRMMLSPAVQNELLSLGKTHTDAWRRFGGWMQANTSLPLHLHDANGYDPLAPAHIVAVMNLLSDPNFAKDPLLFDLLGIEALVDWDPKAGRFAAAIQRRKANPWRAFIVDENSKDLLALNTDVDLQSNKSARLKSLAPLSKKWPVQVSEQETNALTLTLPAKHPAGWLFLNDTYYPGWDASVDGEGVDIQRALGAFRAVKIPVQSQEVTMRYRPLSVRNGFLLSLAALLGIVLLKRREKEDFIG